MAEARDDHTATLLADGRVLVVGGRDQSGKPVGVTEIYDPAAQEFLLGPALQAPRFNHSATLLPDGSVLIVGGEMEAHRLDALDSAELIVPGEPAVAVGVLAHARRRHAAVGLPDGTVLVVGGEDETGKVLASVERYEFTRRRFRRAPPLQVARKDTTLTMLADGSVLVVGGSDDRDQPLVSMELLRPDGAAWEPAGPLQEARYEHTATLLSDGRVLVVGGGRSPRRRLASIELVDPAARQSRVVERLRHPRRVHTATWFTAEGREMVLVVGGAGGSAGASCEIIVCGEANGKQTWRVMPGPTLRTPRTNHMVLLLSGQGLLVVGGYQPVSRAPLRTAEFLPVGWIRQPTASAEP